MKKIKLGMVAVLCLALFAGLLPIMETTARAEVGNGYIGSMYVVNCDSWVSLRSGASTSAPRLTKVPLGAQVENCSWYSGEFIYAEYGGYAGYIAAKYLSEVPEEEEVNGSYDYIGSMYVVNCDSWVSLRSGASTSAPRLTKVPLGAQVENCSWYSADFIYAEYGGYAGYIGSEYLSEVPEEEEVNGSYDYIGTMHVVNCDSWVSLRSGASTSAPRLTKVPLGAQVENCSWYSADFIYAEYGGYAGYIGAEYLEAGEGSRQGGSDVGTSDEEVLSYNAPDGKIVTAHREYVSSMEQLTVICTDADGSVLWSTVETAEPTELDGTDAFIGGTGSDPLLMVYNISTGLQALDIENGSVLWMLDASKVNLGASVSTALDEDGTLYIGGYYGPDPVAISVDGEVLWQTKNDHDAFWLSQLTLTEEGLLASYDAVGSNEIKGQILYGYDGSEISFKTF